MVSEHPGPRPQRRGGEEGTVRAGQHPGPPQGLPGTGLGPRTQEVKVSLASAPVSTSPRPRMKEALTLPPGPGPGLEPALVRSRLWAGRRADAMAVTAGTPAHRAGPCPPSSLTVCPSSSSRVRPGQAECRQLPLEQGGRGSERGPTAAQSHTVGAGAWTRAGRPGTEKPR